VICRTRSHDWRLLAEPVGFGGRELVLVIAGSLASRTETLHRLVAELLVTGPIALLLASLAGYALAAAALRPVGRCVVAPLRSPPRLPGGGCPSRPDATG
jgi:hypothetical protein